jgi:chromosome segregation ATPase
MEDRLAEANALHTAAMEDEQTAHAKALVDLRVELEGTHRLAIEGLGQEHTRELATLTRKLTEAEKALSEANATLEETEAARSRIVGDLHARTEELDETKEALGTARSQVERLEQSDRDHVKRIASLESSEVALKGCVERAEGKIQSDAQLLERAHRALSIGLSLLEEQKGKKG